MAETQRRLSARALLIGAAVLLVTGFLLGFVPQFRTASALRERVEQLERESSVSRARNLAGRLYLELNRRNYGNAGQHATALFDHLRAMLGNASPEVRASLEKLLSQRDAVMAGIAQSDAGAAGLAQQILDELNQLPQS